MLTSAPDDSSSEGDPADFPTHSKSLKTFCNSDHKLLWFGQLITRYNIEVGLTSGVSSIIDPLIDYCVEEYEEVGTSKKDRDRDARALLQICINLDFTTARLSLWEFLDAQREPPDQSMEMPSNLLSADLDQILDALNTMWISEDVLKIHRACAQMRLYTLVEEKKISSSHKSSKRILDGLAVERASRPSNVGKMMEKYNTEHQVGLRWHDLSLWFGGNAIVFVFATSGMFALFSAFTSSTDIASGLSIYDLRKGWNLYQRQCLAFISQHLHSTKQLVAKLGDGALEYYCRHGRLTDEVMDDIKDFNGYE